MYAIGNFGQAAHSTLQSFQNLIPNMTKMQDVASSAISQSQRALIPAYLSFVSNPLVYQVTFLSLLYLASANSGAKPESFYDCALDCFRNNCTASVSPSNLMGKNYKVVTSSLEWREEVSSCAIQCRNSC